MCTAYASVHLCKSQIFVDFRDPIIAHTKSAEKNKNLHNVDEALIYQCSFNEVRSHPEMDSIRGPPAHRSTVYALGHQSAIRRLNIDKFNVTRRKRVWVYEVNM